MRTGDAGDLRAIVLVALSSMSILACDRGEAERCYDVCGPGTTCEDRRCVVAQVEDEADDDGKDEPRRKKSRRGRRRSRKGKPGADSGPPIVDDSHIPKYDPNRTQTIGMSDGTERLPDRTVRAEMREVTPRFNKCLENASARIEGELGSGRIDFVFSVEPTGKVSSVTVKPPANLRVEGLVPCLRKAVFDHRFPSYDGPTMGVDYSFEVG